MNSEHNANEPTSAAFAGSKNLVAVMTVLCLLQTSFFALVAILKQIDTLYSAIFMPTCILYHALITYFLFTLRNEFRYCDSGIPVEKINLANLFTLFRISAMPTILVLIIASKDYAIKVILVVYVFFVFISDFFDGYISRKLKETTQIGKILDSTSDYLILFVVGVSYLYYHMISMYLFFVLLLRLFTQGFIQIAGLVKTNSFNIRSTIFGKIAVASTMTYFFIILIKFFYTLPHQIYDLLEYALIGILLISITEKFIVLRQFITASQSSKTDGGKAMIKSALEIAMEKTKDLKVDKKAIEEQEARTQGKKIAGGFLNNPGEVNLAEALKKYPQDKLEYVRAGIFEILLANLQLPTGTTPPAPSRIKLIEEGLSAIAGKTASAQIKTVTPQIETFLKQYTEDLQQADEAIKKQYAPRLKMKEQEMSARLGQPVKINPMSDPEFSKFYTQNINRIKSQYQEHLDRIKQDLARICNIAIQ